MTDLMDRTQVPPPRPRSSMLLRFSLTWKLPSNIEEWGRGGGDKVEFTIYVFDCLLYFTSNSFSFYGTHGHVLSSLNFSLPNIFGGDGGGALACKHQAYM